MSKVEDKFNELAAEKAVEKYYEGSISDYCNKLYQACKPKIGDATLERFAALIANWNPGKSGIGQKAQLDCLREGKYPKIEQLPNAGKNAIYLYEDNGSLKIGVRKSTNISGVKSFDAINYDVNKTTLFLLKTVDIGKFSENKGGGHQDNVRNEIEIFINKIVGKELYFNGKSVDVVILIDGRSSKNIIEHCQKILDNSPQAQTTKITISSYEEL